jgi:hypothetical protein
MGRYYNAPVARAITAVIAVAAISITTSAASAQAADGGGDSTTSSKPHYIRNLALGGITSILLHEAGHIGTAMAFGHTPTFGFDKLRPTVYSGINSHSKPHEQFLFSAAGLTVQSVIDEAILDVPHARGSAFERGMIGGGIGTTLFYLTIGRTGSVSDVDFMARTHAMTKTQITLLFGSIAALHTWRVSRDPHYANFFVRPAPRGGAEVGMAWRR